MTQSEHAAAHTACPDCHALVEDLEAHEHWHVRLVTDLAKAIDKDLRAKASSAG